MIGRAREATVSNGEQSLVFSASPAGPGRPEWPRHRHSDSEFVSRPKRSELSVLPYVGKTESCGWSSALEFGFEITRSEHVHCHFGLV
jgi:hypothetical protein